MIKINNIYKSYQNQKILKGLSINIKAKTITGLAGSSGSGKSTLLRCIQKLHDVDSGSITCDGITGFMFQDFQLFPHMKVIDNLTYAPKLNKLKNIQEHAQKLLSKLNIQDKADYYPSQLSVGQKQRVALARSLMMNPSLLLCDEPTSGLDIATISDVSDLLKSVSEMGITMIIASHDLAFLSQTASRIILIKNGTVLVDIHPKEIENPVEFLRKYY